MIRYWKGEHALHHRERSVDFEFIHLHEWALREEKCIKNSCFDQIFDYTFLSSHNAQSQVILFISINLSVF